MGHVTASVVQQAQTMKKGGKQSPLLENNTEQVDSEGKVLFISVGHCFEITGPA